MTDLVQLFAAIVLLASSLASISIWAPRKLWIKGAAVLLATGLFGTGYVGLASLLGRPKPVALTWAERHLGEATVLGASLHEGDSIYLWLELEGESVPRAYVLPWETETAQQLQQALATAEQRGTSVKMTQPFESSPETTEPRFYALPQPALPDKNYSGGGPIIYQPPDGQL